MPSRSPSRFKAAVTFTVVMLSFLTACATGPNGALEPQRDQRLDSDRTAPRSPGVGPVRELDQVGKDVPVPPLQGKPDITVPYIELWPNTAGVGETVAVRGMHFCGQATCSPLRIRVDDKLILDNVALANDGTFVAYLTVRDPQGLQHIAAEQNNQDGQVLGDSKVLIVGRPGQNTEERQAQREITATPIPSPIEPRPDYRPQAAPVVTQSNAPQTPEVIGFQPNITWGGRSVAVDVVPSNRDEAIAASESGGLFRTTNQGANWTHLDGLPAFRMLDVKYASTDGNIVIATSAYNSRTANDGGIWRSTNRGVSWSKPATSNPPCNGGRANAYGISVVFSRNEVFVGTECGLAISRDQGATWTHISNWNPGGAPRVLGIAARDYGGAGSVVDLCGDFGHRRSIDGGTGWTTTNGLPAPFAYCPDTAVHGITQSPIDQNVLFITKWDGPITCGPDSTYRFAVYESDNGGASWFSRYPVTCAISRPPVVVADSTASAGQIVVYFSDGVSLRQQFCSGVAPNPRCGTAWSNVSVSHADVNGLVVDPAFYCPMYVVSDGGVHKTSDCGGTFPIVGAGNAGYQALQVYEVQDQVHPGLPTDLYFGTQDNDLWSSVDSGATWPGQFQFEGFFISLLHNTPNNVGQKVNYVACAGCGNFQSGPLFAGWINWPNPPTPGGNPFILEANVYIQFTQINPPTNTTNILNITTNNGGIWAQVPGVAISEPLWGPPRISGPASNPTVYIGVQKAGGAIGLRKIINIRGPGSAVVSVADTGLNNIGIYCMGQGTFVCPMVYGVDPNNPSHLIAADVGTAQMKVSTTGGTSWATVPDLTNLVKGSGQYAFSQGSILQPHFVQWDPSNSNRIFVSTDEAGVIYSPNGGLSWGRLVDSKKVVNSTNFAFDEVLGRTLVASYGRGLWLLDFTQANISIVKSAPGSIGTQVHYVITVTNNGPAVAENTIMTDTLPSNTTFAALQVPAGWACTTPAVGGIGTISCNGGDRSNGNVSAFTLALNVNAGVAAGSSICNIAYARSDIVDNTPGNSAFTCSTTLGDLVVDRSDDASVTTCSPAANDCTLRGAINKVNSLNAYSVIIRFDPSVTSINLTSSLPPINAEVTQIQGNSGAPIINSASMSGGDAFQVNTNGVSISDLSVVNVPLSSSDIHVLSGFGVKIGNNYLGTLPESLGAVNCSSGGVTRNSAYGLLVDAIEGNSTSNPVVWIYGNRVGCHGSYGIVMFGTDGAVIGQTPIGASGRNYVGTNSNSAALPNGVGIGLIANGANGARNHTVRNNTVANNNNAGIWLLGTGTNNTSSTSSNIIAGNRIEHNGLTNGAGGLYLSGGVYFNIIGGEGDADRNEIWGNNGNGISLFDSNANGILGNVVGNASGIGGRNSGQGVYVSNGAGNWLGGFFFLFGALQRGNAIGGNTGDGVQIVNGSHDTLVTRNYIGTNISATAALSNALSGVSIFNGAYNNRLGDGTSSGRNVIAGNGAYGVYIAGSTTASNTITYNDIGLNSAALTHGPGARSLDPALPAAPNTIALPNHADGVTLQDSTFGNVITAATWIANNASGVWITGGAHDNQIQNTAMFNNRFYGALLEGNATTNNTISKSSLYHNGYDGIGEKGGAHDNRWTQLSTFDNVGLGIDRAIADDLQNTLTPNWPVITEVLPLTSTTIVRGLANATFLLHSGTVELYGVAPDPSGHGEGRTYLDTATTDGNGVWQIKLGGTSLRCFSAFETDYGFIGINNSYWYSTEFGPNTCLTFLPVLQK